MKYKCHGVTTIRIILLSVNPRTTVVTSDQLTTVFLHFSVTKTMAVASQLTTTIIYTSINLQITGPVLLINYCSITGQAFCGHTHVPRPRVTEYWTCFLVNTHKHMFFRGVTRSGQNYGGRYKELDKNNIYRWHVIFKYDLLPANTSVLYALKISRWEIWYLHKITVLSFCNSQLSLVMIPKVWGVPNTQCPRREAGHI